MTALGITGFVLSTIAVLISWVPIVNNFAAVLGAIALPFAIAGIAATRRKGKKCGRGLAVAATIIAVLYIVFTVATQGMYSKAVDDAFGTTDSSAQSSTKKKTQAGLTALSCPTLALDDTIATMPRQDRYECEYVDGKGRAHDTSLLVASGDKVWLYDDQGKPLKGE